MNLLQPREVEMSAPWRWAREAFGLIGRRPLSFGLGSLAVLALFFTVLQVEQTLLRFIVVLIVPPLWLGGFMRLAEAADRSQALSPAALLPTNMEAFRTLIVAAIGYGLMFALISAVSLGAAGLEMDAGALADERWRNYADAAAATLGLPLALVIKGVLFGISLAAFSGLLLVLFIWFALPLTQLSNVQTVLALRLSISAYRLNAQRIGLASIAILAVMAVLILLTLGLAAILASPFLGAMLYVSYRDVFLGQAENTPVQTAQGFDALNASA